MKEVLGKVLPVLYGVVDAGNTLSENILIPFMGQDRLDPAQDFFNSYLSQLRI